jgi:hypothetical protein
MPEPGQLVHARLTRTAEHTLCETDGPLVPKGSLTLVLTEANAAEKATVTCLGCLAWMRS